MQRSPEFPLFCQTAIALFSFLTLISVVSMFSVPKASFNSAAQPTVEIARN